MPKPHVSLPPQPAIQLIAVPPQSVHSSCRARGWLQPQPNQEHLCLFQALRPVHSAEVTKADQAIKSISDESRAFLKWPWTHPCPTFLPTELSFGLTWTSEHRAYPASITRPGKANANRHYKASWYQESLGQTHGQVVSSWGWWGGRFRAVAGSICWMNAKIPGPELR